MVFGEFTTELEKNWMDSDIAVGCNPYSADWKIIFNKITKFGVKIKDDDTEKWDQNFPVTEFAVSFPRAYCNYYNIKDKKVTIQILDKQYEIRHAFLISAVTLANFHCALVIEDDVFYKPLQASGVDLTTIFNSICNSAINRCIVRYELKVPFDTVAAQWVFGDDLILNCPGIPRKRFWELALKMFNHKRTDPSKGEVADDTDIWKCFFLQRQFKIGHGILLCPLNIKSINGMLQWITNPKHPQTYSGQFRLNCEVALMELAYHGKELYEKYQTEINIYLASDTFNNYGGPINTTYEEQVMHMRESAGVA